MMLYCEMEFVWTSFLALQLNYLRKISLFYNNFLELNTMADYLFSWFSRYSVKPKPFARMHEAFWLWFEMKEQEKKLEVEDHS